MRITGFVVIGDDGQPYLARMIAELLRRRRAADQDRPAPAASRPTSRQNVWLTVIGTFNPKTVADPINGATIPFLSVTGAERAEQPNNPYQQ